MTEPRMPRQRRARSVTEMLLSVVLLLEAILVFFVTLTVYGMRALDTVPAFVSGGILMVVLLATTQLIRYRWGMWLAWALQLVLLATGLLLPAMYFVSAVFIAMFVYCYIRGGQIDRQRSAFTG